MKIITVIGARPQFIKAAVVSAEILKHKDIEEIIVHTGQHFDEKMSDIFFDQLNIPKPKYKLNINQLSHGAMTGRMMEEIEKIILKENPDYLMVYGDTNSTLAGALGAAKLNVKVVHIEAGLRSFNMKMPEEVNRILSDRISNILFCPTDTSVQNLYKEGFEYFNCSIIKSGDVMLDACLLLKDYAIKPTFALPEKYALATIHRAENTDDNINLENIFSSFIEISHTVPIVIPIHPRTIKLLEKTQISYKSENIYIIPPVSYLEMLYLLHNSSFVLTDSGGLQKEAYFLHKYCFILRNETEWIELTKSKASLLVGNKSTTIIDSYLQLNSLYNLADFDSDYFGDGNASKIIIESLRHNRPK